MLNSAQLNRLEKLAELRRIGALTDEEFEREKGKILSGEEPDRNSRPDPDGPYCQPFHIPTKPGTPAEWLYMPLNRYADFKGRSCRREFWTYSAGYLLVFTILFVGTVATMEPDEPASLSVFGVLFGLFFIALMIPSLAVQVRRFHDQDRSGWCVLLNLIPYVGPLLVLALLMQKGTDGDNRFGPDPLAA